MPRPARQSDAALIALFLDMLAAERGAAAHTLSAYRRDLEDYSATLQKARTGVAGASTVEIRAYLEELDARGLKATTAARRLSAIRQLHRFLYAEGLRGDDPAAVVSGPKRGRTLPKVLSIAEVDQLMHTARQATPDPATPIAQRLRAARLA
jgi:integrase/recombinase XerD